MKATNAMPKKTHIKSNESDEDDEDAFFFCFAFVFHGKNEGDEGAERIFTNVRTLGGANTCV